MRARRGLLVGWAVVGCYAALLVGVALSEVRSDDAAPPAREAGGLDDAAAFVEAWERSRLATFVARGTYERHSEVTGASIASADVVAQRPPRRIHRQLGGVDGRDDDRLVVCPAPPPGAEEVAPCRLGEPGGRTYLESVAVEVEGLRSLLLGADPLYGVEETDPGCFALDQLRLDPRAPFGVAASFCFDPATGAPAGSRVRHAGGIEEIVVVTDISAEVSEEDLRP